MSVLLWGGRFAAAPDAALIAFASSSDEDRLLAPFDVDGSAAHVRVLRRAGLLDAAEADALLAALATVATELPSATLGAGGSFEDVHSAIEARVTELAGVRAGGKLHTGRSRNDQVATALALYLRASLAEIASLALDIARDVVDRASVELEAETLFAGHTHGQPAQPILLAFYLHAFAVGVARSARRLSAVRASIDRCPLGAGPIAGSSLPLDREYAAALLGFGGGPTENALDTVGDRDGALEALFACAMLVTQLSRVAADIVNWSTPALGYVRIDDQAATGSSAMPQKKNPDVFELVRAKAASVCGHLSAALAQLKGLPLSYQRDLQECKRNTIAGVEEAKRCAAAFRAALRCVRFDRERCERSADIGDSSATDLMERLVLEGVPAREAHRRIGERIRRAESGTGDALPRIDARSSVHAKCTYGSTHPRLLATALERTRSTIAASAQELA